MAWKRRKATPNGELVKRVKGAVSIDRLDREFSKYIRARDIGPNGGLCPTCLCFLPYDKFDCSHFIGRQFYATRWDPRNCIAQCSWENRFQEGNKHKIREVLIQRHGLEAVLNLEAMHKGGRKPRDWETPLILEQIKKDLDGLKNI